MMMRYNWGLGVGHTYTVAKASHTTPTTYTDMEEEVLCNSDPSELIGSTSNQNLEPSLSGSIEDNTGSADERSEHSFSSNSDNEGNSDEYSDGEAEALVDMYGEQWE